MDGAASYHKFTQEIKGWIYNNFGANCKIVDVRLSGGTYYYLLHDKFKN